MTEDCMHSLDADGSSQGEHSSLRIDRAILDYVAPFLKGEGFRKNARNFWRDTGNVIDVVTIQKSQWNGPREASFTIELGLYWKDIQRDLCLWAGMDNPNAWDCIIHQRIGTTIPSERDLWWTLTPDVDVKATGLDVVDKLKSKALPWLVAGHDLAVAFRYASVYRETPWSNAIKATIDGRPITPMIPPMRKGFLAVGTVEYDVRTKDGRKAYNKAVRDDLRTKPRLVKCEGDGTVCDLDTKEGKKALKAFCEKTKTSVMIAEPPAGGDGNPAPQP